MSEPIKLQKLLQQSGLGDRRTIRQLITEGKVKVNGATVTNPNFPVLPGRDKVSSRRRELKTIIAPRRYFILHKPGSVVSTLSDPQGRPTIAHFTGKIRSRVFPVGRLDYHSEGLILLTNDGDLTNFILAAKNQVPKTYLVKIKGLLSDPERQRLEKGFYMDGERLNPFRIEFVRRTDQGNSWLRVTITEGKKHILRKAFLYSGHPVEKLRRIAIGTITLGRLLPGQWRELKGEEVALFKRRFRVPETPGERGAVTPRRG